MARAGINANGEAYRVRLVERMPQEDGTIAECVFYLGTYCTIGAARGVATGKRRTEEDVERDLVIVEKWAAFYGEERSAHARRYAQRTVETTVERAATSWEEVPDA